jgi:phospholipid/cholesterol/gamma-HCH transport system substrate-binding protein
MRKRFIDITVGIFFLMGIAALTALAIRVSGLNDVYQSREGYTLIAEFDNIGGLKPRAKVTMAGVSIGRVTSIEFDKDNYVAKVTLFIKEEINNIPDDSQASILTAGLLGDNYIGFSPGQSQSYFQPDQMISVASTNSAVVLEELISKFVSGQASGYQE